ncbi:hydrolase [Escherichia coli]|uniref:Hydrolase n=1 Tax=Escherichia coli TaxID=562 RepID=A0A2X3JP46_ECOLX|nr:hydrolase [Escherichia coli]
MPRLTAKDFPQELLDYYDYYAHGKISKREFLNLAAKYAVGGMTALALFDLLKPNYALATQVEFTDPEIVAGVHHVSFAKWSRRGTGLSGETRKNERQNASRGSGA